MSYRVIAERNGRVSAVRDVGAEPGSFDAIGQAHRIIDRLFDAGQADMAQIVDMAYHRTISSRYRPISA